MAEPVLCSLSSLLGWWILLSTEFNVNSAHHIVSLGHPTLMPRCSIVGAEFSYLLLSRSTRSETEDSAPRGPPADQSSRAEGGREAGLGFKALDSRNSDNAGEVGSV